nr:immunoglobulin heavy chain junction region [Mus musculus]
CTTYYGSSWFAYW